MITGGGRMKLLTCEVGEARRLGALVGRDVVDLTLAYERYLRDEGGGEMAVLAGQVVPSCMLCFLDKGRPALEAARTAIDHVKKLKDGGMAPELAEQGILHALDAVRLTAPIPRPRKNMFCLGLNYAAHIGEGARDEPPPPVPEVPIFFTKPPTSVNGPYDPIVYSKATEMLDYEVEFAFVIGKKGKDIPESEAYDHVAGYMVFNDVSARDLQRSHGQWFKGKGLDTFAPMGPWIVTRDEIPDPHSLDLMCRVNGETRQHSNTKNMIFKIPTIIRYLSAGLTLEPGDIVATGTCSGVGIGMKPPRLLSVGDVVETEIEKIGTLRNTVIAE